MKLKELLDETSAFHGITKGPSRSAMIEQRDECPTCGKTRPWKGFKTVDGKIMCHICQREYEEEKEAEKQG